MCKTRKVDYKQICLQCDSQKSEDAQWEIKHNQHKTCRGVMITQNRAPYLKPRVKMHLVNNEWTISFIWINDTLIQHLKKAL